MLANFFIRKITGSILIDRRVLLSVVVPSETETRLEWTHSKRIQLGLDEATISSAFQAIVAARGIPNTSVVPSLALPPGGVRLATWNGRGVCMDSIQGRR